MFSIMISFNFSIKLICNAQSLTLVCLRSSGNYTLSNLNLSDIKAGPRKRLYTKVEKKSSVLIFLRQNKTFLSWKFSITGHLRSISWNKSLKKGFTFLSYFFVLLRISEAQNAVFSSTLCKIQKKTQNEFFCTQRGRD
jgi:hypothetical protein